jgi:hypothetical protein
MRKKPTILDLTPEEVEQYMLEEPLCNVDWTIAEKRLAKKDLLRLKMVVARRVHLFKKMEYMDDNDLVHNFKVRLEVDERKMKPSYAEKLNKFSQKIKEAHCEKGINQGYLRHSTSQFSSPTILVKKK